MMARTRYTYIFCSSLFHSFFILFWRLQATADGQRPSVPPEYKDNDEQAQELLRNQDSLSGSHCKVDPKILARLGHDLGIGIAPAPPPAAADDDGDGDERLPEVRRDVAAFTSFDAGRTEPF